MDSSSERNPIDVVLFLETLSTLEAVIEQARSDLSDKKKDRETLLSSVNTYRSKIGGVLSGGSGAALEEGDGLNENESMYVARIKELQLEIERLNAFVEDNLGEIETIQTLEQKVSCLKKELGESEGQRKDLEKHIQKLKVEHGEEVDSLHTKIDFLSKRQRRPSSSSSRRTSDAEIEEECERQIAEVLEMAEEKVGTLQEELRLQTEFLTKERGQLMESAREEVRQHCEEEIISLRNTLVEKEIRLQKLLSGVPLLGPSLTRRRPVHGARLRALGMDENAIDESKRFQKRGGVGGGKYSPDLLTRMGVNDLRSVHSRRRPMSASSVPAAHMMYSMPRQRHLGASSGVGGGGFSGGLSGRTSALGQQMSSMTGGGSRPVSSMSVGSQRSNTSRVEVKALLDRAVEGQKIGGTSGNMIVARVLGQILDRLLESDMFSDPIGIYVRRFGLDALIYSISSKDLDVRNRALEIFTILPWSPGDAEEFFRVGGVEPLVDAVSLQDEKGCVLALQNLRTVLVNDDICHCVLEIDGLEKVLSVLMRSSMDETRCDALLVVIALVFTHAGKVLLRRASGIRDCVRFLVFKKTDVVRLAFHLFMIISSDPDNRVEVRNAGAIPVIIRQMHSDDIEVRRSAAAIVLNLSVNEINKEALRDADALSRLVELLSCDDYDTQEFAVRTLANMCIHTENRKIIHELGAVEPVLELLDAMSDTAVRFAIRVTLYLSYVDEARDEIVSSTENMERFLAVLNHRDVRIVQEGLVSLEVLCRNEDTLQYVEDLDYTPVLIRILHKSLQEDQGGIPSTDTMDERVHTMMRKVILRVLARVILSPEEVGLLLKLEVVHGLFPLVNEADANGSFPLRWEIVNLLAILSHADEFTTVLRSSEYCVRVVIDCLSLDDEFVGFSLRILQNTCKDAEVKTLMAQNGAINAATSLFDDEKMLFFKDVVLVLQHLSTALFEYLESIDDRLVDAMLQRLDSGSDGELRKACLMTLKNLSSHPAFGDLLLKLDAARVIRNILEKDEEDEDTILDALVLVKNVSHLGMARPIMQRDVFVFSSFVCSF
jgi:hypothetical protein